MKYLEKGKVFVLIYERGAITHARPVGNQGFDTHLNVRMSRKIRQSMTVGQVLLMEIKKVAGGTYYSMVGNDYIKVTLDNLEIFNIFEKAEKTYKEESDMYFSIFDSNVSKHVEDILKSQYLNYLKYVMKNSDGSWKAIKEKKKAEVKRKVPANKPETLFDKMYNKIKIPEDVFIEKDEWSLLLRNVARQKNTLLIGNQGTGKTWVIKKLAEAVNKQYEAFNMGDNLNPLAKLIGKTWFDSKKGVYFKESRFVKAIQHATLINFDDVSRAHPDLTNVLFSVLDHQRYLSVDESKDDLNVPIHDRCVFFATANEGREFTGALKMDRAFKSRWDSIIEFDYLDKEREEKLIKLKVPQLRKGQISNIVDFSNVIRELYKKEDISTPIDTRQVINTAVNMRDGMTLQQSVKYTILPYYSNSGGATSERTQVVQAMQMHGSV